MKNTKRKKRIARATVLLVLFLSVIVQTGKAFAAKKDTTKPKLYAKQVQTDLTNSSVTIQLKATDASGIASVKWVKDRHCTAYTAKYGKSLRLSKSMASVTVTSNGTYTFYALDKAGNTKLALVEVTNIDTTKPVIYVKPSTTSPTKSAVNVTVKATDASGIASVKYVKDRHSTAYTAKYGKTIPLRKSVGTISLKENGTYTFYSLDKAGNTKLALLEVSNIDTKLPSVSVKTNVMNQKATISVSAYDASGITSIRYLKGNVTRLSDPRWIKEATLITTAKEFDVTKDGTYSILTRDRAGNFRISRATVELEMRAMWISYLEFKSTGYTETEFKAHIDKMFDKTVEYNMNTVIVQVRPFGDAMYPSKYFPWSKYISGEQGKNPGFDPLKYMVYAAHKRGLKFEAWINPYRVTLQNGNYLSLSKDNYARKCYEDSYEGNDRNVLAFDTDGDKKANLYYNPASPTVQRLIINGVKEIVENYDVDGIHFDDYFYPNLGANYRTRFDNIEYNAYVEKCILQKKKPLTIDVWRRHNVNTLVKGVNKAIKDIDSNVKFGISPAGNIANLYLKQGNYVDVKTWMASDEYVDYICPQLYWSFENKGYDAAYDFSVAFDKALDYWLSLRTSSTVNMYVGIPVYRAGSSLESSWKYKDDNLQRMIEYGRSTKKTDGYFFFRYDFFENKTTKKEITNLLKVLN